MTSNTQGNGNDGLRVNFEGSPIVTIASDSIQTSEKMTIDGVDLKSLAKLAVTDANSLPTLPNTERPPGSLVILLDSRTILRVDTTGSVWENADKRGDSILASLALVSEAAGSGGGYMPEYDSKLDGKTIIDFTTFQRAGNTTTTSSSPPKEEDELALALALELEMMIAGNTNTNTNTTTTSSSDQDRSAYGEETTPPKKEDELALALELELEMMIAGNTNTTTTSSSDQYRSAYGEETTPPKKEDELALALELDLEMMIAGNTNTTTTSSSDQYHSAYGEETTPPKKEDELALALELELEMMIAGNTTTTTTTTSSSDQDRSTPPTKEEDELALALELEMMIAGNTNTTTTSSSDQDRSTPPTKEEDELALALELEMMIAGNTTTTTTTTTSSSDQYRSTPPTKEEDELALALELEMMIAGNTNTNTNTTTTSSSDQDRSAYGEETTPPKKEDELALELEMMIAGNTNIHDDDDDHHHNPRRFQSPSDVPVEIALMLEEIRTTQERIIRRDLDSVKNKDIGVIVNNLYYETLRLNQNQTFYGIIQTHTPDSTISLGGDVANSYNPVHIDGSSSTLNVIGYESGTYPFTMNIYRNLMVDDDAVTMASGFVLATTPPAQGATTRTRDFLASVTISFEVVEGEGTTPPTTDFDFALRTRACSFSNSLNTSPEQLDGGLNPATNAFVENVWYAQFGEGRMSYDPTNGFDSSVGGSYSLSTTLVLPTGSVNTVITMESACSTTGAKIRIGNITLRIL